MARFCERGGAGFFFIIRAVSSKFPAERRAPTRRNARTVNWSNSDLRASFPFFFFFFCFASGLRSVFPFYLNWKQKLDRNRPIAASKDPIGVAEEGSTPFGRFRASLHLCLALLLLLAASLSPPRAVVSSVSYTLYLSLPWCPCCHAPPCSIIFLPTSRFSLSLFQSPPPARCRPSSSSFPSFTSGRAPARSRGRNSQHLSRLLLPPPPLIRSLGNSNRQPAVLARFLRSLLPPPPPKFPRIYRAVSAATRSQQPEKFFRQLGLPSQLPLRNSVAD